MRVIMFIIYFCSYDYIHNIISMYDKVYVYNSIRHVFEMYFFAVTEKYIPVSHCQMIFIGKQF